MDETFPDLGSLTDLELKDVIRELTEEETEISYKRRILHGKIDILRAELVNRLRKKHDGGEVLITGEDVQRLTDILSAHEPDAAEKDGAPVPAAMPIMLEYSFSTSCKRRYSEGHGLVIIHAPCAWHFGRLGV